MKAKNDFEDCIKPMINSVVGKTMENIRKHKDINLVINQEVYLKRVIKPNCKSGIQLVKNLMCYEMRRIQVIMNKPIYLDQVILDLHKIIMYKFHYDYMLPKYSKNLWLCYMDTDSFISDIKTDNFYKDIANNVKARFDMSGYSCSRPLPV